MKRNLSQLLQSPPEGGHSKEAFDLHNYEIFHSKGGQFNVVSCRETVPNAEYFMSVDAATRSMLCNTANFANIKENWYFIHVPYALICNNAYQMFVQRRQDYSANAPEIQQFPVFDLASVVSTAMEYACVADPAADLDWFDIHGFNIGVGALRLLDMLGYGSYIDLYEWIMADTETSTLAQRLEVVQDMIETKLEGIYPSVARIGAYQCAWYNFFRDDVYDNVVDASIYNFDDVVLSAEGVTPNYEVTSKRGVENFIKKCLKLHYVKNKKDMFMGSMPGTQFGACASVPMASDLSFVFSGVTSLDKNWMQDVSELSNVGVGDVNNVWIDLGNQKLRRTQNSVQSRAITHDHTIASTVNVASGYSLFDVLTLVSAQAMQKWRQKSMLAGNKTVDQFRAHHGVVPRHLVDHLPDFIGSVDNEIHISEITSTANTLDAAEGSNNLGEIRGRGYGVSDAKSFKFHSDDYGILLLCHSIVAENTYSSFGLDYGNRLIYYSDFFQQEFQNIGMEAVPKFLLSTLSQNSFGPITDPHPDASQTPFLQSQMANLVGMYAKYYGYKEYTDKVHGLFNPQRLEIVGQDYTPLDIFGYADMLSFVVPREDMSGKITLAPNAEGDDPKYGLGPINFNLSRIYQNPRLFDTIFAIAANDSFLTDTFFTKCRFNCDSLLPMTKLGLPDF